jgi:dipeptidyl aminopeptidase/acylaminoacyl peptidase
MRTQLLLAMALAFGGASLSAQAARTIALPDNLVADGIPPIPASLATDVRRYTDARAATFVDWQPDRRELLISTRFGNTAQLHLVKSPAGARTQLTFEDEPIGGATWSPSGSSIVFRRDSGGDEFHQLYRYDVTDGRITLLTDGKRSQSSLGPWSHASDRLAYVSTERNGTDRDVYVLDPREPRSRKRVLEVTGGGWAVLDWSPDDTSLLVLERPSISKSRLWLVNVADGARTPLTADEDVAYDGGEFTHDGRGLYVTTDKNREFLQLGYIDLKTRELSFLPIDIKWNVEAFDLSPNGNTLVFTVNEAGLSKVYMFDTASKRVRAVDGAPIGVANALRWHPNGREFALSMAVGSGPFDVYSIDSQSLQTTRWTESELGGLTKTHLTTPTPVDWTSFDGRTITGFLYRPPARFPGKRPVIISIHGGPEDQFRPTFISRLNYYLQELGIAVIAPNVRGSDGYGKTFLKLDNAMNREDSVKDIGALLDWIGTQPQLDASRVLVTGGSYGGYMTLAVATHYSDRIRAAVDIVGISNFNTFLKNTESYRRDLRRAEYGDERVPEMAAFFERTAPLNNAERIRKPLFVIQGGNDPRVPRTESEQMVARLKATGTPVWYLMAKDEGHGFAKKGNQDIQFYATVMFLREHLLSPGHE